MIYRVYEYGYPHLIQLGVEWDFDTIEEAEAALDTIQESNPENHYLVEMVTDEQLSAEFAHWVNQMAYAM